MSLCAALLCVAGSACAQAQGLKHDPFARPAPAPRPVIAEPAPAPAGADKALAPAPAAVWQPELRAILMAGSKSFVNVDGAYVRIGELVDGYRLVEVHEETAVFVQGRKRVTLTLRGIEPLHNPPPGRGQSGKEKDR